MVRKMVDRSDYPAGINLSSGINNLDQWPTIEYRQMISVDQIPRTIGLMLSDNNENVLNLILKK